MDEDTQKQWNTWFDRRFDRQFKNTSNRSRIELIDALGQLLTEVSNDTGILRAMIEARLCRLEQQVGSHKQCRDNSKENHSDSSPTARVGKVIKQLDDDGKQQRA